MVVSGLLQGVRRPMRNRQRKTTGEKQKVALFFRVLPKTSTVFPHSAQGKHPTRRNPPPLALPVSAITRARRRTLRLPQPNRPHSGTSCSFHAARQRLRSSPWTAAGRTERAPRSRMRRSGLFTDWTMRWIQRSGSPGHSHMTPVAWEFSFDARALSRRAGRPGLSQDSSGLGRPETDNVIRIIRLIPKPD